MSQFSSFIRCVRCVRCGLLLFLLCVGMSAWGQGKPEIKGTYFLLVLSGQTKTFTLYGDNLAPTEAKVTKSPLTIKLVSAKPTEGSDKPKGNSEVVLEVISPSNCLPDNYEVTLSNKDGQKVTLQISVAEAVASELEVKRPCSTFAQAMPLSGNSLAVQGKLLPDNADFFRFDAKQGETWEIKVVAGRAGSALDAIVRVRDKRRVSLAMAAGYEKRDRTILFTVPGDGTYTIELSDAEMKGGATYPYWLSLRKK